VEPSVSRSLPSKEQVAFKWLTTISGIDARPPLIHSPTMSSAQPPNQPPNNPSAGEKPDEQQPLLGQTPPEAIPTEDAAMDTAPDQPPGETWDDIPEEIMALPTEDIQTRTRLIDNDIKVTFLCLVELLVV
jgi:hypothetical protein